MLTAVSLPKKTSVASNLIRITSHKHIITQAICFSFFLQPSHLGLSRAKCCMQLLQELNPDVSSDYIDERVETVLQNNPGFFKTFNAVVGSSLREKTIITLSNILWDLNIPLFLCRSVGFVAIARLQIKEHCVIETHPDNKQTDLRLTHPFPTLKLHFEVFVRHYTIYCKTSN